MVITPDGFRDVQLRVLPLDPLELCKPNLHPSLKALYAVSRHANAVVILGELFVDMAYRKMPASHLAKPLIDAASVGKDSRVEHTAALHYRHDILFVGLLDYLRIQLSAVVYDAEHDDLAGRQPVWSDYRSGAVEERFVHLH